MRITILIQFAVRVPKIPFHKNSAHSSDGSIIVRLGPWRSQWACICRLQKAFDLIDHDILLPKLEAYGVTSRELLLLTNYLRGRRSAVVIDGVQSEYRLITHGVPQGSVLGPLLFIIFMNDLHQSVSRSIVDIYAEDTALSTSAAVSDLPTIQQLQHDINKIANWTYGNKMVLNASKTMSLLVTGKRLEKKALDTAPKYHVTVARLSKSIHKTT